MTQSGPIKKSQPPKAKVVITEEIDIAPPKKELTEMDRRIEELKKKSPQIYDQYVNAIKNQKRATIGPDLSLRIG